MRISRGGMEQVRQKGFLLSSKKRIAGFLCAALLTTVLMPGSAQSASGELLKDKFRSSVTDRSDQIKKVKADEPYYSQVKESYQKSGYKDSKNRKIVIDAKNVSATDASNIPIVADPAGGSEKVLLWEEKNQWFDWQVDIPETGLYEIDVDYYPVQGTGSTIQRSITIDGKVGFLEAYNIPFYRLWRDDGEPKVNNIGDELRPKQVEVRKWTTQPLTDNQGMYSEPFKFYLTQGKHTIRMSYVDEPVAFRSITVKSPEAVPSYEEVKASYKSKGYTNAKKTVKFQAEKETLKSDPTLRSESDGDPLTEPYAGGDRKLNTIGGTRWRTGGQSITWKMNVEEDGLYRIDMRLLQSSGDGLSSYRQIMVDGKVPYKELAEYPVKFEQGWRMETLQDSSGNPYMFYLTKGEHTLTMKVVMGPITDIAHSLIEDTLLISEVYRKIIMITGTNPDPNFEYELDANIPGLMDNLKMISDSMQSKLDQLTQISTKRPAVANNFITIRDQLNSMIKNPDSISRRIKDLNNAQNALGTYIVTLQRMPVTLDYFVMGSPDMKKINGKSGFIGRFKTSLLNFMRSFTKDYDSVGNVYGKEQESGPILNVWIGRGKEWAEIVKEMADEDFTKKTGIRINMNVLPASQLHAGGVNALMLAVTSGKAPDVALGSDVTSPVEFAIRGASYDLSKFKDYSEVEKRFYPMMMVPYKYNSGVYALPEQMDFNVLIYRKDILKDLGLSIPDTWEEVYENVLPVLYQNGMQMMPSGFAPFLFQRGAEYYNPEGTKTALDQPEAYKAFKEWTDQYISYAMPVEANFYNRFRSGEMPIGIAGYSAYMQLATAAPELFGRWDIAMVPGHKKSDGTIDRSIGGIAGQGGMILSQTKYPDESWEFLKWWTSTEVQVRFGKELEALVGVEARWNTANKDAFKGLPWDKGHRDIILKQMEWGKEQPVVLGGYFTSRHLTNAWTRVVTGGENIRDSLEQAVKDINKELKAKQEEYGVK